ncbi:MAG: SPFH domain-containing protein [Dehalococcoidia bacterium]
MAIINFVRDYERVARFRFGRFEGMRGPGIVFAIPIVHQIQKVDTRTSVLDIPRQTNITKDNAPIEIDFLIYMRVDLNQAERAVLEVEDYRMAVVGLATTTLRAVIGDIDLDDVLSQRDRINELIRVRLDHETGRWGIKVTNVEIREIDPPREIQDAMNRQMSAERVRRAVVLEADGTRQSSITVAEGQKQSEILRAEGEKQAQILQAEGERQAAVLRAQGFSDALAEIYKVAQEVDTNTMTLQYMEALKALGESPSTKFIFPLEFTGLLGSLNAISGNGASPESRERSSS